MEIAPPEVGPWTAFRRALTRFDRKKIVPEIALRNTIGFTAALTLATVFSSPAAGVLAGIGALNVSYSDSRDPYPIRLRRMLQSSLLCGLAITLGSLSGHSNTSAVIVATLWAFGAGMLVALGTTAGDLGVITLVTLVVFAARPLEPLVALQSGLLSIAGGLLQTFLAIALWPIRRYEPERRIIATLYRGLADMARSPGTPSSAPQLSAQLSDAHDALTALSRDHTVEAERHVFLLNQAERVRLSVLTLGRLMRRLGRDGYGHPASASLAAVLKAAADSLDSIAGCALQGKAAGDIHAFAQAATHFHTHDWGAFTTFHEALIRDANLQLDALGGQLRAASGIAESIAPKLDDRKPADSSPKADSWYLRFPGTFARLQANLSLHSTVFRHALRLAVCLGLGDAIGRSLSLQRTYWIPMTIAIVLKPDFTATVSRGVLRIAGTFAGLILATALFHFLHTGVTTDIVFMAFFVFLLRLVGPANYGIFVTALSAMVVLLIATTGVAPATVISARALNTAAGGLLAMIAYAVWPTWERTLTGPVLADLLDAYRDYFASVLDAYTGGPRDNIDAPRMKGRRARSNAEASVERMSGEPLVTPDLLNALNAILVNSHAFVHAAMALEAGLDETGQAPPRAATLRFGDMVQQSLTLLAGSLRTGEELPDLPNLREAHNAILNSTEVTTDRYALVNVETDRIVTSVNTVAEQIRKLHVQ